MKRKCPHAGRPQADTIEGSEIPNLKELRVSQGRSVFRLFFVFDPRRNCVILCGGDKAGDKRFYQRMIPLAEQLYRTYLAEADTADGK